MEFEIDKYLGKYFKDSDDSIFQAIKQFPGKDMIICKFIVNSKGTKWNNLEIFDKRLIDMWELDKYYIEVPESEVQLRLIT
jgi:hypothetical protein